MVVNVKDNASNSKGKKNLIPVMNKTQCLNCKKDLNNEFKMVRLNIDSPEVETENYCLKCGLEHIRPIIESDIETYRYISKNHTSVEFHDLYLSGRIYPHFTGNIEKSYNFFRCNTIAIETILSEYEDLI